MLPKNIKQEIKLKLDRLLAILTLLLERTQVTAPELAEKFEVSRRTIIRDIDTLDRAGFPIQTRQGLGGGISLMEGFRMNERLLRREEMEEIITGLKGLSSISSDARIKLLMERLAPEYAGSISIDLASFYKDSLSEKIGILKNAICNKQCVSFIYYSSGREEKRIAEPSRILYKWSDWYLEGFCRNRNEFRIFKLNRLWELTVSDISFDPKPLIEDKMNTKALFTDEHPLTVLFDPSVKHLIVEAYGPDCFTEQKDGGLLFQRGYTNRDFIVRWLLQFGEKARVIEPESLADELKNAAEKILENYSKNKNLT